MAPSNLSETELRTLQLAWQCFKTMPEVDYEKLAEIGGWKTKASATTAYCKAKKKLLEGMDDTAIKAPKPAKRAAPATAKDGPPKKRGKKAKKEVGPTTEEESDDAGDKEETKIKKEEDLDSVAASAAEEEEDMV